MKGPRSWAHTSHPRRSGHTHTVAGFEHSGTAGISKSSQAPHGAPRATGWHAAIVRLVRALADQTEVAAWNRRIPNAESLGKENLHA